LLIFCISQSSVVTHLHRLIYNVRLRSEVDG